MAIALRAAGAIVHGTIDAAPAYPVGILAGDLVCLGVAWKDETATAPTLAGWSKMIDQVVGAGADGAATGQQRLVVYCKDTVAGGESGTVTVTPSGSVNVVSAAIIAWSKTASSWSVVYDWGTDATAGANLSAPSQTTIPLAAGDLVAVFAAHTANTNMGSSTVTTTGVTYGTAVEHVDAGTTNGNDQRIAWVSRPVSSGTASSVTTFTSTITGTTNGGAGFVRLRELASVTTTRATTWDALSRITATRATTWNVAAAGGLTSVTTTRSTTWRTRTAVTGTRATTWRTRAAATATRTTTWDALASVTPTRATTWRTLSRPSSTRTTTWNVASSLVSVTTTRPTTWRTLGRSTSTRATSWDVLTQVGATKATMWRVLSRPAATRAATWDTLTLLTATRTTTWDTLTGVTATLTTTWDVLIDAGLLREIHVHAGPTLTRTTPGQPIARTGAGPASASLTIPGPSLTRTAPGPKLARTGAGPATD